MTLPTVTRSLSARLLVLTIFFVMLAEVLIYTPSIARFRQVWLEEKLAAAHLAALTTRAAPEGMVTADLADQLLGHVGAHAVYLRMPGHDLYKLGDVPPVPVSNIVDLDDRGFLGLIADAFDTMINGDGRMMRVSGVSPRDPAAEIEVILSETPLCAAMLDFSWRILGLSIIISLITASLVFLALRWLTVRPLSRFTEKMVAFRQDPEDADNIIMPSRRTDEVGVAERELHDMQIALRGALKQRARLAALGTAVTKINHDLRNILSTASLLSEHLAMSEDPEVRPTASRLMDALDRAVDLCAKTLAYTREGGPPLRRANLNLCTLVDAAESDLAAARSARGRPLVNLLQIQPGDVALSMLPVSHVLERAVDYYYWDQGAAIAYAESVKEVARYITEVRPHVLVSVPRLFDKIHSAVLNTGGMKGRIARWAARVGAREVDARLADGLARQHRVHGPHFGFNHDNFCGTTAQPNPACEDGFEFFARHRLGYQAA